MAEPENKNTELESARTELRKQNRDLTRKSIELSDVMRQLEDKNFDLELAQEKLKNTLEALKGSETRYRHLVENTLAGIYIAQNDLIIFCNRMMAEIFGYAGPEELLGKHVKELVAPESWELALKEVNMRETGQKKTSRYELKCVRKDGNIIELELLGSRIEHGGEPAVLGTLIDISQRKQAELVKQKLEKQL
ncbi:MAG: PAS domain S-box protein, partial [bacterium]|nr:PAS domain S-box protein [bacterium]